MFRHCQRGLALLAFVLGVCALLPLTGAVEANARSETSRFPTVHPTRFVAAI